MIVTAAAPGRINLIGEHTDYNEGFVMPASIDKTIKVRIEKNGHPTQCNAHALNINEHFSFSLNNMLPQNAGWQNYIIGVTAELQKIGARMEGFDVSFGGDVPIGAGLSSSAALECSLAVALNELFDLGFRQMQLIKAAQLSEHNFAGTKCGIMDQFASMMGRENSVIRLDCKTLDYDYFPLDLGTHQLLLLNTNVSHSLGDSEYNTRRAECEEAVSTIAQDHPEVKSLRYVSLDLLEQYRSKLRPIVFQRAKY
ncbi:MAG: galactokinase family protein, partial [Bacteroidota bacterium]